MTAHAKLSASGSSKWLNCPGSVQAEEKYPPQGSSVFALEGTMAHEVADLCLKNEKDAIFYVGKTVLKKTVERDMSSYVQEYLDYVRSFEGERTTLMTEERVDFSHVVPGGFGTLDAAVLDYDNDTCHIFDLKYGKGIKVDSYENTQAQLYALGIEHELSGLFSEDIDKYVLHIVQPRINHFSSWEISLKNLQKFAKWVEERADLALSGKGQRVPGEKQCQWCRAKGDCRALSDFTEALVKGEFDDLDSLDSESLSHDEKKAILGNKKLIESFLKAVEASVFDQIERGEEFEGYKLVEGRSIRKWNDKAEHSLISRLGSDAYNRKLIGIGEAEKRLGKEAISNLTIKPKGKTTLALSSDKRESINSDLFNEI
jgi:hypothetical protein